LGQGHGEDVVAMETPLLWLASTSPRRRALLAAAGIPFGLCEPGPEYLVGEAGEYETQAGEPKQLALRRAQRKGAGAQVADPAGPVLAVDTVVDLDGRELGKPRDRAHAERMLTQLLGREHWVHCLATGFVAQRLDSARVACGQPDPASFRRYLDSGDWRGKAGSYGVQDAAQGFFRVVDGSFDTVVGLHVPAVRWLLAQLPRAPQVGPG
jgi:septum formation protein